MVVLMPVWLCAMWMCSMRVLPTHSVTILQAPAMLQLLWSFSGRVAWSRMEQVLTSRSLMKTYSIPTGDVRVGDEVIGVMERTRQIPSSQCLEFLEPVRSSRKGFCDQCGVIKWENILQLQPQRWWVDFGPRGCACRPQVPMLRAVDHRRVGGDKLVCQVDNTEGEQRMITLLQCNIS